MRELVSTVLRPITVSEIWEIAGEAACNRWEALGQTASKVNWAYGAEAEALIVEGMPAMQVYKAIAIKAGVSSQTVRKSYNVYMAFGEAVRRKYELCPYSAFRIAHGQKDPEEVLKYYQDRRCSIDELKEVFPPMNDVNGGKHKRFVSSGYPRYFWGILREVYGSPREREALEHLDALARIIKELNDEKSD